ncbi:exocyst complex component Sec3-domain-containing protein [Schizophyllum commune]
MSDVRSVIIQSVFNRRNAAGNLEETYIAHVKVWEDAGPEGGGRKPRYILLSQSNNGSGFIHKSKMNNNGTFSVGKTWRLPELRGVTVINPSNFSITLSRTYRWETEDALEQRNFVEALVRLFHTVTNGQAPLRVEGIAVPEQPVAGRQPIQNDYYMARSPSPNPAPAPAPTPSRRVRAPAERQQRPQPSERDYDQGQRIPSPAPRSQSRAGPSTSRPASPAQSSRSYGRPPASSRRRDESVSRMRPPSPTHSTTSTASRPSRARPPPVSSSSANAAMMPPPPSTTRSTFATHSASSSNLRTSDVTQQRSVSQASSFDDQSMHSVPNGYPSSLRPGGGATSPAPETRSRKQSSRSAVDTQPPPPPAAEPRLPPPQKEIQQPAPQRRDQKVRISFFDHANQATVDRLLAEGAEDLEGEGEDESAQATLANVEEMIEGYEYATDDVIGRKTSRGAADLIQARLLEELAALDKANIHSFLESDDRIGTVLNYVDKALAELDNMDSMVTSYKIHLNAVSEDISFIQGQNRGLQVQTQNQHALLGELQNLLQTVQVSQQTLVALTQESLEKPSGIQNLEEAAAELYKALQAAKDRDMAATMERLESYHTHNSQFCKRILDYLTIMFTAQSKMLLGDFNGVLRNNGRLSIVPHTEMEQYLGRYAGLMLYLKEMDEAIYAKLCAAYFSAASELHSTQVRALLNGYLATIKKASEDEQDQGFGAPNPSGGINKSNLRRAGTVLREGRKDKEKPLSGDTAAADALSRILEETMPIVTRESEFIADFLQINEAGLTFADYMGMDNYFRRQAARQAGLSQTTMKLVRGALDLIFGFLPMELKGWLDAALAKDNTQIVGMQVVVERFVADAEERGQQFMVSILSKQQQRLKGLFDRHVNEQIKNISQTKMTTKKRQGVAPFVKYFPVYISRIESQLVGAESTEVRVNVDTAYERIVQGMFDALKAMAKMDGEDEDKGQLNYHVVLIENMHHFVAETSQISVGSASSFLKRAKGMYEENLNAYVKIVLRRPFSKIIDFFEGVERNLKTTAPAQISNMPGYGKSALKKVVKEYDAKDIRKHVDALFKRVEKHFDEASEKTMAAETGGIPPGTVMVGVWKACEEELLRITELFNKRLAQCYAESGVSLEYTPADVEAAFRRHRL